MSSANRRTKLAEQIAAALGSADCGPRNTGQPASRSGLRNSIAYGSMVLLTANPVLVGAAGFGEVALKSNFGQPLNATIPLTLGPGESVSKNCIQPAPASGNLAPPPDMRVHSPALTGPGTYELRVTTANPLHEPMYELSLMIKCQGNAMLVRQYVLMLDLPGMPVAEVAAQPATVPAATVAARIVTNQSRAAGRSTPTANATRAQRDPARALAATKDSITAGGQYRVARGDTLSTIARRVTGRLPDTTWGVANQIFADNPRAFIGGNPDMIKLGSLLRIPETAVLASMTPVYRRSSLTQASSGRSTPGQTNAAPTGIVTAQPEPRPIPAPQSAAPGRADRVVSRNSNTATTQSVPVEPFVTELDTIVAEDVLSTPIVGAEPVPATVETLAETSVAASPFADEMPGTVAETTVIQPEAPAELPTSAAAEASDSSSFSSLLSILVGLLLGAAVSLLLLRGRLMAALGLGRRKQPAAVVSGRPQTSVTSDKNEFDQSQAAAAFDHTAGDDNWNKPLAISAPPENTYIVEHGFAEPTLEIEGGDTELQEKPAQAESVEPVQATSEFSPESIDDDSAELAALFETSVAGVGGGPTAEMPIQAEDAIVDPSAELPGDAMLEVFDPTGGVDDWEGSDVDETLLDAFDENLTNVDADEMFATGKLTDNDLISDAGLEALAETINDPVDGPDMAMELDDLPTGDDLSDTLQEALELLERDYEDEFTASQIIERATLEEALKKDREPVEAEEDVTDVDQRKIS